eukprot:Pgem_evm1s5366
MFWYVLVCFGMFWYVLVCFGMVCFGMFWYVLVCFGHCNEKNFVGLTTNNGYLACGSEDNSVYIYSKDLKSPLLSYKFTNSNGLS